MTKYPKNFSRDLYKIAQRVAHGISGGMPAIEPENPKLTPLLVWRWVDEFNVPRALVRHRHLKTFEEHFQGDYESQLKSLIDYYVNETLEDQKYRKQQKNLLRQVTVKKGDYFKDTSIYTDEEGKTERFVTFYKVIEIIGLEVTLQRVQSKAVRKETPYILIIPKDRHNGAPFKTKIMVEGDATVIRYHGRIYRLWDGVPCPVTAI